MIAAWIVVIAVAFLAEIATFALVSIWFMFGGIAALIAAAAGLELVWQLAIFCVVSAVLLIFTRPIFKKLLPKKPTPTNSELLVGRSATVIEEVDTVRGKGRVKLDGVDWIAVSDDGEVIPAGEAVTVADVRGAKLAVKVYR